MYKFMCSRLFIIISFSNMSLYVLLTNCFLFLLQVCNIKKRLNVNKYTETTRQIHTNENISTDINMAKTYDINVIVSVWLWIGSWRQCCLLSFCQDKYVYVYMFYIIIIQKKTTKITSTRTKKLHMNNLIDFFVIV